MEKSKKVSLIKRILTSLVLIPVVLGCLFSGKEAVELLALTIAALLSWEWAGMMPSRSNVFFALSYFLAAVVAIMFDSVVISAFVIVALVVLAAVRKHQEKEFFLKLLGIPYIAIGVGSVMALYNVYGVKIVLWYIVAVWAVDTGGYLFGSTLRGPKLAPKISPNKTWAGLFGGMLLAVAITFAACYFSSHKDCWVNAVILAALLTIIAQIGDLVESAIKRHLNLKDSSNLIPGHGGVFDRVDGLIFAAPFAFGLLKILRVVF